MDPLLEKELEQAAQRRGVTKSQFIVAAVQRALGRQNPYTLMLQAKAEMEQDPRSASQAQAFVAEYAQPYDTERSRADLIARLKAKHGIGAD
jgi:RHH-type rel operon transcriptional repressor/antitoxin RelB